MISTIMRSLTLYHIYSIWEICKVTVSAMPHNHPTGLLAQHWLLHRLTFLMQVRKFIFRCAHQCSPFLERNELNTHYGCDSNHHLCFLSVVPSKSFFCFVPIHFCKTYQGKTHYINIKLYFVKIIQNNRRSSNPMMSHTHKKE